MSLRDIKARDFEGVTSIFGIDDLLIAAGVSAIGGIIGGSKTAKATSTAANAATDAAAQNNALARELYGKNETNLSPYIQQGYGANPLISGLLGTGGDPAAAKNAFNTYLDNAGFNNELTTGQNTILQQRQAGGSFNSGAALKGLSNYNNSLRSNYLGSYLNSLTGQQGVGLNAANGLAGVSSNYSGQVAANNNSAADAKGNAALAGAANTNALIGSGLNALGSYAGLSSYGKPAPPAPANYYASYVGQY